MLNKLQFNNLVISNKKKIQQSRIQTINKLVQKLRKLKSMLEKRPDDVKNKERLRKTTENMEQLKKLKCVEVMKRILLLDKNPTAIVTNGRATPEEIAIAMLAMNKIMMELAKRFREELNLSEEDTAWKEEILETSTRRTKIIRTEEKRRKRKDIKEQKAITRKRVEWMQENKPEGAEMETPVELKANTSDDEKEDAADILSAVGAWKVEEITKDRPKSKRKEKRSEQRKNNKKLEIAKKQNEVNEKPLKAEVPKSSEGIQEPMEIPQKRAKIESKRIIFDQEDVPSISDTSPPVEESVPDVTHVVDPFFFTDTGENYLSTAVITRTNEQPSESNAAAEDRPCLAEFGYERKTRNERFEKPRNANYTRDARPQQFTHNKRAQNQKASTDVGTKNLHPSWAAKQKQKPIISNFEGTKITFTDDGATKATAHTAQNDKSKHKNSIKGKASKSAEPVEQLHPSWVAKQKQKPSITAFQGKKITFDD